MNNLIIHGDNTTVNVYCQEKFNNQIIKNQPGDKKLLEKCQHHKAASKKIQTYLYDIYKERDQITKASRIAQCGSFLHIRQYKDEEKTKRLNYSNFCKHPLCPMCAWRLSVKWARNLFPAVTKMITNGLYAYHCILTMPSVKSGEDLRAAIQNLRAAEKKFFKNFFDVVAKVEALEITVNGKKETYHPHIHAIILSPCKYPCNEKKFIAEMRKNWCLYMPTKYGYTICALYPIKETQHDVSEVCKYILSPKTENLKHKHLAEIIDAIHGLRKIITDKPMSKAIKEAAKITAAEEAALMEHLMKCGWEDFIYRWNGSSYIARE